MAGSIINGVRIAGISAAVPAGSQIVEPVACTTAAELEKIIEKTGVKRRHIAQADTCTSDLCAAAAQQLLAKLGWEPESVDLLIFVSQTPDHLLPATSCVLHGKLGLAKSCAAFDISLGCSGYVYGLNVAAGLLAAGAYRRALLLVGDTISKVVSTEDRSVAYVFGDAGSATTLERADTAGAMAFELGTDGTGIDHLKIPAGGFRCRSGPHTRLLKEQEAGNRRSDEHLFMNGAEIFNFTIREVPPLIKALIARAGWSADSIECWVMHQANRFMLEYLGRRMKLPVDKTVIALENYGNTSCASIPLALADRFGGEKPMGSGRCVLAGFGVGFSWAGVALDLRDAVVLPVLEYSPS